MLTLLLVLGTVTCSPVPSDLPALSDTGHIEVTHEVRHVTFEVSEEVNEATASSHIPPDVAPEEDPPIPTVTTPHTVPEEQHPQDEAVSQDHLPEGSEGEISHEASTEIEATAHEETKSEEKEIEVESEEKEQALPEDGVSESENVSESEIESSESDEIVPESHAHVSSESESNSSSLPDDSMLQEEPDASGIPPVQVEAAASVNPTEVLEVAEETNPELVDVEENPILHATDSASQVEEDSAQLEEVVSENPAAPEAQSSSEPASATIVYEANPTSSGEAGPSVAQDDLESSEHTDISHQDELEPTSGTNDEVFEHPDTSHMNTPSSDDTDHISVGELLEEIPSQISQDDVDRQGFLETEKRVDDDHLPIESDVVGEPVEDNKDAEESVPETTRESRVFNEHRDEYSSEHDESDEESAIPESDEDNKEVIAEPVNSGLESMSMTSPTPDSLAEDVPEVDDVEKDEAPPAEHQEETAITDVPKIDLQEENSNLTTDLKEPDVVPEVVINPPSSSVAPIPGEEFTDNYSDPLEESGNLPDFDVTHEQLPSKSYPLPNDAELIPENTHDHAGDLDEGESSDLAAGDHTLEVEAGPPRVLLPQQEQISAAAPSSLTPGCIVAIVFGVLVSLVVILGVGGFILWQRRTQNRPKVLGNDQGYAGSDSGGYIDDQVRVSYVNSQTDTPKGSPEDLISLDNDSFLNSLESMTIQNLWTDNIRHTKL